LEIHIFLEFLKNCSCG